MSGPPPQTRSVVAMIFRNFINSFKPRQIRGDLKGSDDFGNKYFEIPADPAAGKRKARRWFEPVGKEDGFDQEMPAEWEAWLRGRRSEPPSLEEIAKNAAIIAQKRKNAVKIEANAGKPTQSDKGFESFPQYTEYERMPGKKPGGTN